MIVSIYLNEIRKKPQEPQIVPSTVNFGSNLHENASVVAVKQRKRHGKPQKRNKAITHDGNKR